MKEKKKEYLIKALLLQSAVCGILFFALWGLKSSNSEIFMMIEEAFSEKLEKNLTVDEAEAVFSGIVEKNTVKKEEATNEIGEAVTEAETVFVPFEEPSLNAEIIATGGNDVKISSDTEIPDNVCVSDYKLNQKMVLPVINGNTTSEFGVRTHPITNDLRFHAGIDIAADMGESIYSAFDGEVIVADYDQWNGNFIKIMHDNNIMTVYCHCEKLNVEKGQKIRAGEVIATVGSTGSSTGPHLHFELRINNVSYNPQIALGDAVNAV